MWTPFFLVHQKVCEVNCLFLRVNSWRLICPRVDDHSWTRRDVRMTLSPLFHQQYSTQTQKHSRARLLTSVIGSWLSQKCQSNGSQAWNYSRPSAPLAAAFGSPPKEKVKRKRMLWCKKKKKKVEEAAGWLWLLWDFYWDVFVCRKGGKVTPEALRFSGLKLCP